jgi:protein involved in polysaccharide export with SLBB domain
VLAVSNFQSGANAQVPLPPTSQQNAAQPTVDDRSDLGTLSSADNASDASDRQNTSMNGDDVTAPQVLSTGQIIRILQQTPDLVVELKSQLADRLQMDANDISDEMLFEQISANASLRAYITMFLRARGYVSQDDLQAATDPGADDGHEEARSPSVRSSLQSTRDMSPEGLNARERTDEELDRTDEDGSAVTSLRSLRSIDNSRSRGQARSHEEVNTSTDLPKVLRQPAPYNLRSMRDLYTQIPEQTAPLKRFGSDVFVNRDVSAISRGSSNRDTPLDVPLGPDYVLGSGDTLTINMWGGVTQSINRTVDRDGRILLPEAGSLDIAGLPLERAQGLIEGTLQKQFRNVHVAVTVSRLRAVRVYVVGDVQRPGGYDISSLATPLSALYAAGGPTAVGSLRIVHHYRGKKLVDNIDLYDFLLHGIHGGSAYFESGDTLLVPPTGPQVAIFGAVKRPAIYELRESESTLLSIIDDAGGFTASASPGHITIDRIDANRQRETLTLNATGLETRTADRGATAVFPVEDGDRIYVAPILPYSQRVIYLEGHVVRPGRLPYSDGMRLSDVLRSFRDMLPEPAAHGEIVRLVPPDLHAETISFNLPDVMIGNSNVDLQPFDTIHIFGRYEVDAPKVTINGEVQRPGTYPLSSGMTAAQLVRMAGGFKRDALLDSADLSTYGVIDGNRVVESLGTIPIGAVVSGVDAKSDILLKPDDILTVRQITGWNDIGESVTIEGQVRFPGSYGFQEGERLSSVLRRAGGILPTAYPEGAILVRDQVREVEEKSREELIRQIETNSAAARLSPVLGSGDTGGTLQLIKAQQDEVLTELKNHPPSGRMVIHISADVDSWANTSADIELRRGDMLTVPKRPGFVIVTGQVYNATALTFTPNKTAGWYLSRAGGTNATANRKEIFVIRANGSVIGRHSGGWFAADVLSTKLDPGDVVVVPQKIIGASLLWRNLLTTAQLASSIAITAAVAAL